MKGGLIECRHADILRKVDALGAGTCVGAVSASAQSALFAEDDHVLAIGALYLGTSGRPPVVDDAVVATVAARLVA